MRRHQRDEGVNAVLVGGALRMHQARRCATEVLDEGRPDLVGQVGTSGAVDPAEVRGTGRSGLEIRVGF